ncbi:MAG: trypsin-like peptidase domain-containing protein [Planctomycetes bacterium]|nr:trypsin-like peptidase domain-containing protein [Planctomycetota bacterium]
MFHTGDPISPFLQWGEVAVASLLARQWLHTTVRIENQWGDGGTGFLVSRPISEKEGLVFLVTNKHVIHEESVRRNSASHITCYFNSQDTDNTLKACPVKRELSDADGTKRYREHSDADTDVLAVNVTPILLSNPGLKFTHVGDDAFADSAKRTELDITAGDEIATLGYPLGFRQGDTSLPLLRQGILATEIGCPVCDVVENPDGSPRERMRRAFLVDGATVPGSSGSPVVLKPVFGRLVRDKIEGKLAPPLLLGIVAETRYAPIVVGKEVKPGFANLGLAFDVETIRETIDLFFS